MPSMRRPVRPMWEKCAVDALRGPGAALLANHGMVAVGPNPSKRPPDRGAGRKDGSGRLGSACPRGHRAYTGQGERRLCRRVRADEGFVAKRPKIPAGRGRGAVIATRRSGSMGTMTELPPWPSDVSRLPDTGVFGSDDRSRLPATGTAASLSERSVSGRAKPGGREVVVAGALLVLCVGLHIAAMFPAYSGNPAAPVVSVPYQLAVYITLEVGWALAAALVLSRVSVRGGVALGAGIGAVELGFLVADLASAGQVSGRDAPGVWLALAALGVGYAGVLLGASAVPIGKPQLRGYEEAPHPRAVVQVVVALLAVAAFLPSWDSYHVVSSTGQSASISLGNAFSQPGGIMAGEVISALAIGAVCIVAAFWAPLVVGAWLTAGVVTAMTSQLISAVVQVHQTVAAPAPGDRASLALTGFWTLDVAATVVLAGLALWAGLDARKVARDQLLLGVVTGEDHVGGEWPSVDRWPGQN